MILTIISHDIYLLYTYTRTQTCIWVYMYIIENIKKFLDYNIGIINKVFFTDFGMFNKRYNKNCAFQKMEYINIFHFCKEIVYKLLKCHYFRRLYIFQYSRYNIVYYTKALYI